MIFVDRSDWTEENKLEMRMFIQKQQRRINKYRDLSVIKSMNEKQRHYTKKFIKRIEKQWELIRVE